MERVSLPSNNIDYYINILEQNVEADIKTNDFKVISKYSFLCLFSASLAYITMFS